MTAPTRAQIEALIGAYDRASPFRTADYHHEDCDCLRCCVDRLRASLAEPQPAPVEPVAWAWRWKLADRYWHYGFEPPIAGPDWDGPEIVEPLYAHPPRAAQTTPPEDVVSREAWQPIETAPRDGTRVLAYYAADDGIYDVCWDQDTGQWVSQDYDIQNFHQPDLTHWMGSVAQIGC